MLPPSPAQLRLRHWLGPAFWEVGQFQLRASLPGGSSSPEVPLQHHGAVLRARLGPQSIIAHFTNSAGLHMHQFDIINIRVPAYGNDGGCPQRWRPPS